MSFNVTTAFVQQFSGNLRMLAQQRKARLEPCVVTDTIMGESGFMEQLGATAARKRQARHEDTPIMSSQHLRRRITPYDYEWGDLIDRADRVRMLIDPDSAYARAAAFALERSKDDEIIAAFYGTAYAGKSGNVAVAWPGPDTEAVPNPPGGTVVAVNDWTYGNGSGNTGLTISKLISASVALSAAETDSDGDDTKYLALGAAQIGSLLSTTEVTSADYNSIRALESGTVDSFMGFTIIRTERLLKNAQNQWRIPAWKKSGMGLGYGRDIAGQIAVRPDKSFSTQVFADGSWGGTRMEESMVVEIVCA